MHLIVRRCLEKDPDRRFQTVLDLAFALEAIGATSGSVPQAAVPASRRRLSIFLTAAAAFVAGLLGAALLFRLAPSRQSRPALNGITFAQLTDDTGEDPDAPAAMLGHAEAVITSLSGLGTSALCLSWAKFRP